MICSYLTLLIVISLLIIIKLITIGKSGTDPTTFPSKCSQWSTSREPHSNQGCTKISLNYERCFRFEDIFENLKLEYEKSNLSTD